MFEELLFFAFSFRFLLCLFFPRPSEVFSKKLFGGTLECISEYQQVDLVVNCSTVNVNPIQTAFSLMWIYIPQVFPLALICTTLLKRFAIYPLLHINFESRVR